MIEGDIAIAGVLLLAGALAGFGFHRRWWRANFCASIFSDKFATKLCLGEQ